ncbi:MAG TPA: hypothetical protein VGC65_10220 [Bacteroidia bacterium]|jgi:hypothetical protein
MNSSIYTPQLKKSVLLFGLFLLFSTFSVKAQEPLFTIKLKFSVQEGGLDNSLITITRDGKVYRTIDPSKGKYNVDLELGSNFVFTFTKPGHITKQVIVNTVVPNGREKEDFAKFIAEVGLEMQPEDKIVTYSQPVGRIKYDGIAGDFNFDNDYTQTAIESQKKDKEIAKPKPKEPPPAPPKPEPPKPVAQTIPPSNPVAVVVKQPEYTPEPAKPQVTPSVIVAPYKPVVKNKEEKIIQRDRLKITVITVTINGTAFEYKKEEYSWGGTYYYRDGKNITEPTFDKETE